MQIRAFWLLVYFCCEHQGFSIRSNSILLKDIRSLVENVMTTSSQYNHVTSSIITGTLKNNARSTSDMRKHSSLFQNILHCQKAHVYQLFKKHSKGFHNVRWTAIIKTGCSPKLKQRTAGIFKVLVECRLIELLLFHMQICTCVTFL